ncbi:MAG: hypothetical protein ABUK01_00390 [Leptospirales bacterium]
MSQVDLKLTPEEMLAGSQFNYDLTIPEEILKPAMNSESSADISSGKDSKLHNTVTIVPLSISRFQLIMKAAKNDPAMIPLLMIKESLREPSLSLKQIEQLHMGLVRFLIQNIREISGLLEKKNI